MESRDFAAETIVESMDQYSENELINVIRYLGRVGNIRLLTLFLQSSQSSYLKDINAEVWSKVVLETIKQFEYLGDLTPLDLLAEYYYDYDKVHLLEAVRIASNSENLEFLRYIIENPRAFHVDVRAKANEELFRTRPEGIIPMDENKIEFRGRLVENNKVTSGVKKSIYQL